MLLGKPVTEARACSAALFIVEIHSGGYLGEDDIVRFEDRCRRV